MTDLRRFIFRTRGVYLLAILLSILWLKHRTGARVGLPFHSSDLADISVRPAKPSGSAPLSRPRLEGGRAVR